MIGFRNVLAHGYDIIDHARVWQIIQAELPPLMAHATALRVDKEPEV